LTWKYDAALWLSISGRFEKSACGPYLASERSAAKEQDIFTFVTLPGA
jgi:hypothetical protein